MTLLERANAAPIFHSRCALKDAQDRLGCAVTPEARGHEQSVIKRESAFLARL